MEKYSGKAAFKGIAMGKTVEIHKKQCHVEKVHIDNTEHEIEKLIIARDITVEQLQTLQEIAMRTVGEVDAHIFTAHREMIMDVDYIDHIIELIRTESFSAEYAIFIVCEKYVTMFNSMEDMYISERSVDLKDVSERMINNVTGKQHVNATLDEPSIVIADDLSPSETIQMDKSKVLAFVTRKGSVNSHTAILSRTMGIPAIVSCNLPYGVHGKFAIVNAFAGFIILQPGEEDLFKAKLLEKTERDKRKLLNKYRDAESITKGGKRVNICANIGFYTDVQKAFDNGADGIGLFRSEFLYLERSEFPTEEEQYLAYKNAAQSANDRKLVIRTLDVGGDKQLEYFHISNETNPALGYRAIRVSLTMTEMFKTQIRALLRAALYGNIKILLPLVSSIWEIQECKRLIDETKAELTSKGIRYGHADIGIMIETPASAMISDELSKEVDFISIGTNDLSQYSLAIDRQNQRVQKFFDPHHTGILKLIKYTIDCCHENGVPVSICGDLAADTKITKTLVEFGIDELSVAIPLILPLKKELCELDI